LQRNPEQLVQGRQSTARSLRVQSQQLLTESHVFKDEVLPRSESADHPPKEMPKRQDHGKNLIGKVRIEPCAKSFILWVYDVLASHNPMFRILHSLACSLGSIVDLVIGMFRDGLRFCRLTVRSRTALSAEILFLRKQLAFYEEHQVQPGRLNDSARFSLVLWSRLFDWKKGLVDRQA
jgi:hypothetical protein